MKKMFIALLVTMLVVGMTAVAFATIANTKHNLTTSGGFPTQTTDASATLCGFCHIPHGGSTATPGLPLWARSNPVGPYTPYGGGSTLAGTTIESPTAGGGHTYSLTCLSCHDGTIGVGTITKNGVQSTFAMTGNVDANGRLVDDNAATAYNPVVGTDLQNDHPVGFYFPAAGYGVGGGIPGISLTVTSAGNPDAALIGASTASVYPVFNNMATADAFECATCHDPHLEDIAGQTKFLRGPNATLCQDCHDTK